jgi:hypothetical protein
MHCEVVNLAACVRIVEENVIRWVRVYQRNDQRCHFFMSLKVPTPPPPNIWPRPLILGSRAQRFAADEHAPRDGTMSDDLSLAVAPNAGWRIAAGARLAAGIRRANVAPTSGTHPSLYTFFMT